MARETILYPVPSGGRRTPYGPVLLMVLLWGLLAPSWSVAAKMPPPTAGTTLRVMSLSVVGFVSRNPSQSLVPLEDHITNFEARWALARLLAYDAHTLQEALDAYRMLLDQDPDNLLIRLEMARVLVRLGHMDGAGSLIRGIAQRVESDPEKLVALADVKGSLGHASECRDLYTKAIEVSDHPQKIRLKLADQMNRWGDFYGAETIYRAYLAHHPGDRTVSLKLAAVLSSSERYAEAEAVYRAVLLDAPDSEKALLGLAGVKRAEKQYDAALRLVNRALKLAPQNPKALLIKADLLRHQKKYDSALALYARLSAMKCCQVKGLMGQGKVYLDQGEEDVAHSCFIKAGQADPRDIEARFYALGTAVVLSQEFIQSLLEDKSLSAMTLEKWARLYAVNGYNEAAIKCYEASLERDPEYFPSQIDLAEILAIDHQYERAVKAFEELDQAFPQNRKILMGWARTLGWGRKYDQSIALYDKIHAMAPDDPVPQMEKARTAVWAKQMDLATKTYDSLLVPPADQALVQALAPVAEGSGNAELIRAIQNLAESAEEGSVYQGRETFIEKLKTLRPVLTPETNQQIDAVLIAYYPSFAIQKAAFLEGEGKRLFWNKRLARALDAYESLLDFRPGNQEALFDYAQIECALGLCDREEETYRRLLRMDPLHSLAGHALNRLEIRRSPSLKLGQIYWAERGRDGLTEIDRYRTDFELNVPVDCRFHLKLTGHHWIEHPSYTGDSYGANGFTLGVGGTLNPYIRGEAGWTKKRYQDREFENTDTGYAHIWFNLKDYVKIGLGYDRADELYNYFGIQQGVQSDSWWMTFASHITRRLEALGEARYLSYSDHNAGQHYMLGAGYSITDHPRIFKVALAGEYRNTHNPDVYHYEGGRLVDITHPYWTPKDYYGGTITFEWYHDLSRLLFCGSQQHFYDLALAVGTDTEHNPSVELRGEWHYDFLDHWTVSLKGLIHRSKLWDAEGVWADIRYQF